MPDTYDGSDSQHMNPVRRRRKLFWTLLLVPLTVILLLVGVVYVPSFQRWAIRRLVQTLEERTGWEISVKEARIRFPLHLEVDKLLAMDRQDTVLWVDALRTSLPIVPLFNKHVEAPHLEVQRALIAMPLDSLNRSRIDARAELLEAGYIQVDLTNLDIDIAAVSLRDGFFAYTQTDTTESSNSKLSMSINVNRVDLTRFASYIHLYPWDVHTDAYADRGSVDKIMVQIPDFNLLIEHIDLDLAKATYARDTATVCEPYVDYTHMHYYDAHVNLDNLYVDYQGTVRLDVNQAEAHEQCGAHVKDLRGYFELADEVVSLRNFAITTPTSHLTGDLILPLGIFTKDQQAIVTAEMTGSLAAKDIYYCTQINLDSLLYRSNPYRILANTPISIDLRARGSLSSLDLPRIYLQQKGLFALTASGRASDLLDKRRRMIHLQSNLQTGTAASLFLALAGVEESSDRLTLPSMMELDLDGTLQGEHIKASVNLSTPKGEISLTGSYAIPQQHYQLTGHLKGLDLHQFLPQDSLGVILGTIGAEGVGLDLRDKHLESVLSVDLDEINYKSYSLQGLSLYGSLQHDSLTLRLRANDPSIQLESSLYGDLSVAEGSPSFDGKIDLALSHLDLKRMGLSDSILEGHMRLTAQLYSDFAETHKFDGELAKIDLMTGSQQIQSDHLSLSLYSDTSQIVVRIKESNLDLHVTAQEGMKELLTSIAGVSQWIEGYRFDAPQLTTYSDLLRTLPRAHLTAHIGARHPLRSLLQTHGVSVESLEADLHTSPKQGISGQVQLYDLQYDTLRCDKALLQLSTLSLDRPVLIDRLTHVSQQLPSEAMRPLLLYDLSNQFESKGLGKHYTHSFLQVDLSLKGGRRSNQMPYQIIGSVQTDLVAMSLDLDWLRDHELYYSLGASGYYNKNGFGLNISDKDIYIAGKLLHVNEGNALFYFRKDNQIFANLELISPRGTQLTLHSELDESTSTQSLLCNVQRLELGDLTRILRLPRMSGRAFMDVRIERLGNLYRATGDLSVNKMTYQDGDLGSVSVAFFYEPRDNNSHYVTAQVSSNGDLALTADGIYHSLGRKGTLDMEASFRAFPLYLANPFLSSDLISLAGTLDGAFSITGTPESPILNGTPHITDGSITLAMTGNKYLLDKHHLSIRNSRLALDNYRLTLEGEKTSIYLDGWLSLFGPEALKSDLHLYADHAQVIDSKHQYQQSIYGRAVLSADLRVQGFLTAPQVRGSVTLHGGTNATYVLSQAAIKAQNNMSGVVDFVNLSDTTSQRQITEAPKQSLGRMDLSVALLIEPAVQIGVDLSPRGEDYIRIQGGGDLRLKYPPLGMMSLVGRYDFNGGEVQYEFPVVGRRHFDIDHESYLVWSGNLMDPYLHFIASQKLRADVTEGDRSHKVDFEVSIKADENLNDLTLSFDLAAPEDLSTQNKLSAMSEEERGKQAVAMLVSGTFLASDLRQISVEQVLSSVAMSELNNLTGKLLQGTSLSLGMELGGYDQSQLQQTNYTYSFSRRFLDDRIRFVIGGRVASGNLPTNYEQTFIDNVTFEYRLDEAGRQYVTLFHRRNNDNILEGVVSETGVGYLVKLKARNFIDLLDPRNYLWWRKQQIKKGRGASLISYDSLSIPSTFLDSIQSPASMGSQISPSHPRQR